MGKSFWRRLLTSPFGLTGGIFIVVLILIAVIGPMILTADPSRISSNVLKPPSGLDILGTDELGRDVLLAMIYGISVSLTVGFTAAVTASIVGILIGSLAGYYGGWLDNLVMRVSEIFQVMPTFVLAAIIVAIWGAGLLQVTMVIAILSWPQVARIMRGEVLRVSQTEFVDAVRCMGFHEGYILFREVIPNALRPVLAIGTLIVGQAILLEAALSYLGLSSPDIISWGRMLNSGQRYLMTAWWMSVFPGLAIFLTVLAFNLLGDAIGSALNPKAER